ncbi:ankyrin repeat-containing protein At5g02620-like [Rosa rugosa]|uniref:ankyrin repeat-containing protein At5g02620-like n=1 Tax=Rosa rugosa TaxID=74645 RepID=UPI002B4126D1|nr:ankyrin repeat-containing protein At5g02620-like [Rosa rugosa]
MVSENPEMIKKVDELGWTPLHYAAFSGNVEAIGLLIQRDSSAAYILDRYSTYALHVAAYAGCVKVIKELIRLRPATCDLLNHEGQTVVHAAVLGKNLNVIKYILKTPEPAGLVNEADNGGNTRLHLAAFQEYKTIMIVLAMDRKVDKTATNNDHLKAIDIFLVDDIEMESFHTYWVLSIFDRSTSVLTFQRYVRHDFMKLESSEDGKATSTTATNANDESVEALLDVSKRFDTNLVVAMLIATVTFSAAFTIPGGYNSVHHPPGDIT